VTTRRGFFWPLLLIVLGVVFLGANFGVIPPIRALDVANLWPLLLVLLGIDIALSRRSPLLALAAEVAVIALGVALVVAQPVLPEWLPFATSAPSGTSQVSVPRGTATALMLHLAGGAGTFTVHGGASALVQVTSDRDDLRLSTGGSATRVDVRVDQGDRGPRFGASAAAHVDASVARDVVTSLDMDAGAGEFLIDLGDVKLTDARLNVGAASLRVVLPRPAGDVAIVVSAGASNVVIEVPDGVEARVTSTGALLATHIENPRFTGSETTGYASAKDRVTIRVTAGASTVTVR